MTKSSKQNNLDFLQMEFADECFKDPSSLEYADKMLKRLRDVVNAIGDVDEKSKPMRASANANLLYKDMNLSHFFSPEDTMNQELGSSGYNPISLKKVIEGSPKAYFREKMAMIYACKKRVFQHIAKKNKEDPRYLESINDKLDEESKINEDVLKTMQDRLATTGHLEQTSRSIEFFSSGERIVNSKVFSSVSLQPANNEDGTIPSPRNTYFLKPDLGSTIDPEDPTYSAYALRASRAVDWRGINPKDIDLQIMSLEEASSSLKPNQIGIKVVDGKLQILVNGKKEPMLIDQELGDKLIESISAVDINDPGTKLKLQMLRLAFLHGYEPYKDAQRLSNEQLTPLLRGVDYSTLKPDGRESEYARSIGVEAATGPSGTTNDFLSLTTLFKKSTDQDMKAAVYALIGHLGKDQHHTVLEVLISASDEKWSIAGLEPVREALEAKNLKLALEIFDHKIFKKVEERNHPRAEVKANLQTSIKDSPRIIEAEAIRNFFMKPVVSEYSQPIAMDILVKKAVNSISR